MARLPRLYAPGLTQLVLATFSDAASQALTPAAYRDLVRWIGEASRVHGAVVHGWCICPTGIALVATPGSESGLPSLIQVLGRNLAPQLQVGSVFSGRYRSCLLQAGLWVLHALIWVERFPVRQTLLSDPEQWPWSSAGAHTGSPGHKPAWLQQHVDYWACGNTPFDRQAIYRTRLQEGNTTEQDEKIAAALRGQWALGDTAFITGLGELASRRVIPGIRGRPRRKPVAPL